MSFDNNNVKVAQNHSIEREGTWIRNEAYFPESIIIQAKLSHLMGPISTAKKSKTLFFIIICLYFSIN